MTIKQPRPTRTPTVTTQRPQEATLVLKTIVEPNDDEHALTRAIHGAVCEAMRRGRRASLVVTLEEV